jgi:hypothetical protein
MTARESHKEAIKDFIGLEDYREVLKAVKDQNPRESSND